MSLLLQDDLFIEYTRWIGIVGDVNLYSGPGTLGIHDVLRSHFLIAEFFAHHEQGMASVGPRDISLLHSALNRQFTGFRNIPKWKTPIEIVATLFFGLIKNHPFHDANKRTALLSLLYHLMCLKMVPTCSEKDLENLAVNVADDKLSKYSIFRELKSKGDSDKEVKTIAWFLKRNIRQSDRRFYHITFNRLKQILNRFGYDLQNPRGNTVDVVRIIERRKIFGILGEKEQVGVKVAQIGFPSWTKDVGKGAIKTVREKTGLTHKKGIDSATFFKDEDPIDCLIARYQEPLISLANR